MSAPTPCLRHPHAWLAYCDDCTAWHLARQLARPTGTPLVRLTPDPRPRHLLAA
jgi:hypothetical protein